MGRFRVHQDRAAAADCDARVRRPAAHGVRPAALAGSLVLALLLARAASGDPIVFVVAETAGLEVHGDSYLLVLEQPTDIAYARDLIQAQQSGGTIVVARIAPGGDGLNRDVLAPGEPPWSWQIVAFEGFAEITAEILDGWPSLVEADVDGWIAGTNGFIGFWHYSVVAELPEPGPRAASAVALAALAVLSQRRRERARPAQRR